jgi:hypothetical protein
MAKTFKIFVELYDLLITARKDDRSGRVASTGSLKADDLIAITRRSDVNAAAMKVLYDVLREAAPEEVCNGKTLCHSRKRPVAALVQRTKRRVGTDRLGCI